MSWVSVIIEGFGCQKDKSKAFEYSRLAAYQKLPEAQYLCGVLSKNKFVSINI